MTGIAAKSGLEAQGDGGHLLKEQPTHDSGTQDLLVRGIVIGMNPAETMVRQQSEKDVLLGWDAYGIVEKNGHKTATCRY